MGTERLDPVGTGGMEAPEDAHGNPVARAYGERIELLPILRPATTGPADGRRGEPMRAMTIVPVPSLETAAR